MPRRFAELKAISPLRRCRGTSPRGRGVKRPSPPLSRHLSQRARLERGKPSPPLSRHLSQRARREKALSAAVAAPLPEGEA